MTIIKKDTWYVLVNGIQTRFKGIGKAGWESKDLPIPFPLEYTNEGICNTAPTFNVDHERTEDDLKAMIGKRVVKCSGDGKRAPKPFKSGSKENTVKDIMVNPFTHNIAFTFIDDDSCVDCNQCFLVLSV